MKPALLIFLSVVATAWSAEEENSKAWKHPEPITYQSLRDWHNAGGLKDYHWPKEHKLDLNGDGIDEVFLAISGYGRGMEYALFTKNKEDWILICDAVEGSHHGYDVLPAKLDSWHDFKTLTPSGRGGLFEFIYTWDGKHYIQKSSREITAKELPGQ